LNNNFYKEVENPDFMKYGTMLYLVFLNSVLVLKKEARKGDPNSGYFSLPGGKLESYEKGLNHPNGRLEGALRELWQETGINVINPVWRGVILFDNERRTFSDWKNPDNFYVFLYSAEKYEGNFKKSEEGIPYMVPLVQLNSIPSNPGDKLMYEWLKDGRNFAGVIKHKGNEIDKKNCMVNFF